MSTSLTKYLALFGNLVKNPQTMASYLAGFRNYAYYHIQASKCYLHSRVLKRINIFLNVIEINYSGPQAVEDRRRGKHKVLITEMISGNNFKLKIKFIEFVYWPLICEFDCLEIFIKILKESRLNFVILT